MVRSGVQQDSAHRKTEKNDAAVKGVSGRSKGGGEDIAFCEKGGVKAGGYIAREGNVKRDLPQNKEEHS